MTRPKHSLILALVALALACSDRPTAPSANPETASATLIIVPVTLKFKVSGNWKILVDNGDYVKKVAGDSVEYVVSSSGPVRVPGSAVSTDATGGATYGLLSGSYAFLIDWAGSVEGSYPVWTTGDYLKLVSQNAYTFTFEITSGSQFNQTAWTQDNTGNVRFARCDQTPECVL
jgi:hypothetical protein